MEIINAAFIRIGKIHASCTATAMRIFKALIHKNHIRALMDYISISRMGLSFIAVLVFSREQVLHNGGDTAAVGDDTGILLDFGKSF